MKDTRTEWVVRWRWHNSDPERPDQEAEQHEWSENLAHGEYRRILARLDCDEVRLLRREVGPWELVIGYGEKYETPKGDSPNA